MKIDIREIINDFIQVSTLAGVTLSEDEIILEILPYPHSRPKELPSGKMAVYIFLLGDQCLKIGKAGPKSKARYTSQHYNHNSSQSNLAKSILKEKEQLG